MKKIILVIFTCIFILLNLVSCGEEDRSVTLPEEVEWSIDCVKKMTKRAKEYEFINKIVQSSGDRNGGYFEFTEYREKTFDMADKIASIDCNNPVSAKKIEMNMQKGWEYIKDVFGYSGGFWSEENFPELNAFDIVESFVREFNYRPEQTVVENQMFLDIHRQLCRSYAYDRTKPEDFEGYLITYLEYNGAYSVVVVYWEEENGRTGFLPAEGYKINYMPLVVMNDKESDFVEYLVDCLGKENVTIEDLA